MKYATAISPHRINATGRVNRPRVISGPPTSSKYARQPQHEKHRRGVAIQAPEESDESFGSRAA